MSRSLEVPTNVTVNTWEDGSALCNVQNLNVQACECANYFIGVNDSHSGFSFKYQFNVVGYEQPHFPYVALPHVAHEEPGQPYGGFNLLQ